MKGNFKVGDKVKIIKATSGAWGANGRIGIVVEKPQVTRGCKGIARCENGVWVELVDNGEIWNIGTESELELIKDIQSVHITTKGNEIIAVLKNGKETVKIAKAKCSPSDTFSFEIGAKLAVERLFGTDKPGVKEVKRIAKIGDWVRIVKDIKRLNQVVKKDEIVKITHFGCMPSIERKDFYVGFKNDEYVVLENYQPKPLLNYTSEELLEELLRREK